MDSSEEGDDNRDFKAICATTLQSHESCINKSKCNFLNKVIFRKLYGQYGLSSRMELERVRYPKGVRTLLQPKGLRTLVQPKGLSTLLQPKELQKSMHKK